MRRAGLTSIRRKTGGGLALDRPIHEQRAAFARLLELTQVGMPEHRCESLRVKCGTPRPAVGAMTVRSPPFAGTHANSAPSSGKKPP